MTDKPAVLFVCVHNAGRSQMATGYLTELAHGAIEDWALGDPAGKGIETVRRVRHDIRGRVQTLIDELLPDNLLPDNL
jgi:protein-tyrosine-phosphatase